MGYKFCGIVFLRVNYFLKLFKFFDMVMGILRNFYKENNLKEEEGKFIYVFRCLRENYL